MDIIIEKKNSCNIFAIHIVSIETTWIYNNLRNNWSSTNNGHNSQQHLKGTLTYVS
jgi:hypothetical protein